MIVINNNVIARGGVKIGFIENGRDLYDHEGNKRGYFIEVDKIVYDKNDKKVAYIQGDNLYVIGTNHGLRLEDLTKNITGGLVSDTCRAAIMVFFGS